MPLPPGTWGYPPPPRPRSAPWSAPAPTIVAEALAAVPDPLLTALRAGPVGSGAEVARALARSLRPDEDGDEPPPWLLPHQVRGFRYVLAAIRRYGGALLADPVGSGKTYVALAVATALDSGPTACLVPAPLVDQWRAVAARLGAAVVVGSHQQVSRGRLPEGTRGLVIVDESHHFRHPRTKRYRHLAPWLVGRPTLLLSATPVVNRLDDLAAQLLLAVRDDALALDGVLSLRALLAGGRTSAAGGRSVGRPGTTGVRAAAEGERTVTASGLTAGSGRSAAALGRLVFESADPSGRPRRIEQVSEPDAAECTAVAGLLDTLARLRLSRSTPIAALVRNVLWRAAGSSPAALTGALRRYRALLLHAQDAARAGRAVDRAEIRRFTGEMEDQLLWWELLPGNTTDAELELVDLGELDALINTMGRAVQTNDSKVARLRALLTDGRPTLIFTTQVETVRYLRDRLPNADTSDRLRSNTIAWCTGESAGIGRVTAPRNAVLDCFRDRNGNGKHGHGNRNVIDVADLAPARLLITTDVAAEGLDLRRIERVVHYDLPWTPMRLEQREGRAVRLGSAHEAVEVVRFALPHELERRLQQTETLVRKARLPAAAGLGSGGRHLWRWRAELAARYESGPALAGIATIPASPAGVLAGYSLHRLEGGRAVRLASALLWLDPDGQWTEDPGVLSARLEQATASDVVLPPSPQAVQQALSRLAEPVRARLTLTQGRQWAVPDPTAPARELAARLGRLSREAARRRSTRALERLDRALRFVAGGHTAGEGMILERLTELPDGRLLAALARLPLPGARASCGGIEVKLTGLVLFDPNDQ